MPATPAAGTRPRRTRRPGDPGRRAPARAARRAEPGVGYAGGGRGPAPDPQARGPQPRISSLALTSSRPERDELVDPLVRHVVVVVVEARAAGCRPGPRTRAAPRATSRSPGGPRACRGWATSAGRRARSRPERRRRVRTRSHGEQAGRLGLGVGVGARGRCIAATIWSSDASSRVSVVDQSVSTPANAVAAAPRHDPCSSASWRCIAATSLRIVAGARLHARRRLGHLRAVDLVPASWDLRRRGGRVRTRTGAAVRSAADDATDAATAPTGRTCPSDERWGWGRLGAMPRRGAGGVRRRPRTRQPGRPQRRRCGCLGGGLPRPRGP